VGDGINCENSAARYKHRRRWHGDVFSFVIPHLDEEDGASKIEVNMPEFIHTAEAGEEAWHAY